MLQTSFLLKKLKMESNSINTGDRVMVLAFCNSPHGPLSKYHISLNYLQHFKRYAPDKCVTDGQKDYRLHALPLGNIKKYNYSKNILGEDVSKL